MLNKAIILGTLVKDVDIKVTPGGLSIGSFTIAVNDRYKKKDGTPVDKAYFFDITAMGKVSEIIQKYFNKGSRILVTGSLVQDTWTTQDGSKRSKVSIKLEEFEFVDKAQNTQPQQAQYDRPADKIQYATQATQQNNMDEIPFGYIGLSEGRYYQHLI